MVTEILSLLRVGLSLWESKEKTKYLDEMISLEKRYYEEGKKTTPDHAVMDDTRHAILRLSRNFTAAVKGSNAPPV